MADQQVFPPDELTRILAADDLRVAPLREDDKTYGTPTWVWCVAVGDALYVRAYHGKQSRWYQAALRQPTGRITAAGLTRDVTFEPVAAGAAPQAAIEAAYRAKYAGSTYLGAMVSARAQGATMRLVPR